MVMKIDDGNGPGLVQEPGLEEASLALESRWGGTAVALSGSVRAVETGDLGDEQVHTFVGGNRATSYGGVASHLLDPSTDLQAGNSQPSTLVVDVSNGDADIATFRTNRDAIESDESDPTRSVDFEPDECVTVVERNGSVRRGCDLQPSALQWLAEVDPQRN